MRTIDANVRVTGQQTRSSAGMGESTTASHAAGGASLLEVENLSIAMTEPESTLQLVSEVTFSIGPREVVGLVGESGSGKTMTAMAIMGLLPSGAQATGEIRLEGRDLLSMSGSERHSHRGKSVAVVFQDPVAALNPVFTVGQQLLSVVRRHRHAHGRRARDIARAALNDVGLGDPEGTLMRAYPHQLSGGMCQRVMVAMTLVCDPRLLIADEPTTSLDVTTQAEIVSLLVDTADKGSMSMLFISHDLGVVSQISQRVIVMYAGEVVESGPTDVVLRSPQHPYTRALLECVVDLDSVGQIRPGIPGRPPAPGEKTIGCRFAQRCRFAQPQCRIQAQVLARVGPDHLVRCWRHNELTESLESGRPA